MSTSSSSTDNDIDIKPYPKSDYYTYIFTSIFWIIILVSANIFIYVIHIKDINKIAFWISLIIMNIYVISVIIYLYICNLYSKIHNHYNFQISRIKK